MEIANLFDNIDDDPIHLLTERGPAVAYPRIEALLRDPVRYDFYVDFLESLRAVTEPTQEELNATIAEIAESGLVGSDGRPNPQIDPMMVLAILRDRESLDYLQASVLASESEHWQKPVELKTLESKPVESKPVESKPLESKPLESMPLESKPRPARLAPGTWNKFRAYGPRMALAVSLLMIVGLLAYSRSQAQAQSHLQEMLHGAQEMYRDIQAKYDDLMKKITDTGAGQEVPPSSRIAFQDKFERARRFQPRSYENEPKLGLVFDPFIGPPYYVAVQATWDGHSQWIYRAGRVSLEPEVVLDFKDIAPDSGEKRINLVLQFDTTGEAMQTITGTPPAILENIPLVVSAKGVRVASADDQAMVTASISSPVEGEEVDEKFVLEMTLQRPMPEPNANVNLNRMVHVLIRPLDGYAGWQNQYYIVPFRERVDALSVEGEKYTLAVSLRGILETIPQDQRPSRFEILVVDAPFQLDGWTVGKNVVDFDLPEARKMVRERITILLRPSEEDEL